MTNVCVLEAKAITKRFFRPAPFDLLNGIDLQLYKGERVAIVGK